MRMTKGIYCYIDKKTSIVIYIGRFTGRKRIKAHIQPSKYNEQQINRVLQNNPNRYEAKIICEYPDLTNDELNYFEIKEILKHKFLYDEKPKFNFTVGGEGATGYKHTDEALQKMRKPNTKEHNQKISEAKKGKKRPPFSDEWRKNLSESHKGINHTDETKNKISEANNGENNGLWKDYARIIKKGFNSSGKQRYIIKYNGKQLKQSNYIHKLYKWFGKNYPNQYLYLEV